ncbi:MAG: hypothetical protein ACRDJI_00150 [Actinomycetota bacterium]
MRAKTIGCLLILTTLAALSGDVVAGKNERPPKTRLRSGGAKQADNLGSYCWTWTNENDTGGGLCSDTFQHDFPKAERVRSRREFIRFKRPQRPNVLSLTYWRSVDEDGEPKGDEKELDRRIRKHIVDGEVVAYDARFRLPKDDGHYYLSTFVRWKMKNGSGGDASYDYHAKLML